MHQTHCERTQQHWPSRRRRKQQTSRRPFFRAKRAEWPMVSRDRNQKWDVSDVAVRPVPHRGSTRSDAKAFLNSNNGKQQPKGHMRIQTYGDKRVVILALSKDGNSIRAISVKISRSRTAVTNVLHGRSGGVVPRRRGRRPTLSRRDTRRIIHAGCTGRFTARQIHDRYEMSVAVQQVQQLLRSATRLSYTRMLRAPNLSPFDVQKRCASARAQLHCNPQFWHRTVYSDENRLCLEGPNGVVHYWADKRLVSHVFSRRLNGVGDIMVWGAFCLRAKLPMAFCCW